MNEPVFFQAARSFTVDEAARMTGATVPRSNLGDACIDAIASLRSARAGAAVFVEGRRQIAHLANLEATAIFCTADLVETIPDTVAVLVTRHPQRAFSALGRALFPDAAVPPPLTAETAISSAAHVDPTAMLEAGVIVEAGAVIGPHAAIGAGSVIGPQAVIGANCQIGRGCRIGAQVVVQHALVGNRVVLKPGARIGQDGFGFVAGATGPERVPQIGRVILQDNVEIGANTTIDRGALDDTVVGENTKIDNQVQVAHNVRIGRNCLIAGRVGISGSCTIGDGVMMGGGVGLADHLTIGDGARLAAGSGFMTDVPANEVWAGYPAKPIGQTMRETAALSRLAKRRSESGSS